MIKAGSPEDMDRMMARLDADKSRPMDDTSPIRDFPKYGRPLVQVGSIYGKAVAWSHSYGLIEWLDSSGQYHLGWAQSASINRVSTDEWKGSSGLQGSAEDAFDRLISHISPGPPGWLCPRSSQARAATMTIAHCRQSGEGLRRQPWSP